MGEAGRKKGDKGSIPDMLHVPSEHFLLQTISVSCGCAVNAACARADVLAAPVSMSTARKNHLPCRSVSRKEREGLVWKGT